MFENQNFGFQLVSNIISKITVEQFDYYLAFLTFLTQHSFDKVPNIVAHFPNVLRAFNRFKTALFPILLPSLIPKACDPHSFVRSLHSKPTRFRSPNLLSLSLLINIYILSRSCKFWRGRGKVEVAQGK